MLLLSLVDGQTGYIGSNLAQSPATTRVSNIYMPNINRLASPRKFRSSNNPTYPALAHDLVLILLREVPRRLLTLRNSQIVDPRKPSDISHCLRSQFDLCRIRGGKYRQFALSRPLPKDRWQQRKKLSTAQLAISCDFWRARIQRV